MTMPAQAGVKRGKLEPEQDRTDAAGGFHRICSALLSPRMKSRADSFLSHEKVDAQSRAQSIWRG